MTEKEKQHAAPVTGSDEIDIGRLVGTVIEARWWVIGITTVVALCAVVYTFFATPIYSADISSQRQLSWVKIERLALVENDL
ncbi:Wzz/FepE/Etk N-terminal domain-containing protein, partial [Escherichia coli]|nr:Wzz/FepE/Etk N-terminal domain-containing protein [Escherichia coli]